MSAIHTTAARYCQIGIAVVPVYPNTKRPIGNDWQHRAITDPAAAVAYFTRNPSHNLGALLGASRLVSLDLDDYANACAIFKVFGVDVDAACARSRRQSWARSAAHGCAAFTSRPEGVTLGRKQLTCAV